MKIENMRKFYVYVLLDPRKKGNFIYDEYEFDYEPFYVGKGNGKRCYTHFWKHIYKNKKYFKNKVFNKIIKNNLKPIVIKINENLLEEESFLLEIKLIKTIGRRDKKQGPLTNGTNGGDGTSGHISLQKGKSFEEIHGREKSDGLKKHYSNLYKGKTLEEIHGKEKAEKLKQIIIKNLILRKKGDKLPESTRKNISKSLIGNKRRIGTKHTDETKKQISKTKKGMVSWNATPIYQLDKNDNIIKEWRSATFASKELKISQGNIWSVINGNRQTAGGFKWKLK